MLRSLSSGVSGVTANQTLLDVVGDNISNSNTTGYKKSNVNFQELMSQTQSSATAPSTDRGGTNAEQIGLGTSVGSVTIDQTQGNIDYTGTDSDMAISGDGFFIVENGSTNMYSRNGSFIIDGSGDMVQSGTGYRLQGYAMYDDPDNPGTKVAGADLTDINIPEGKEMAAKATSSVAFTNNLDSTMDTVLPMGLSAQDFALSGDINGNKYSSITFSEGASASDFLNITFAKDDGTSVTVAMALDGVNSDSGLPSLADASFDFDGDGTNETVSFDDSTGQLTVTNSTGDTTLWTGDISSVMNYEVVDIDDGSGSGNTLSYLAEFDDNLDGGRTLTLWGDDVSGNMTNYDVTLASNDDGSFNIPSGTQLVVAGQTLDIESTSSDLGIAISQNGSVVDTISQQTSSISSTKYQVYDSQGNVYTLETSWEKVDNNTWRWRVSLPDNPDIEISNNTGLIEFSAGGSIESVTDVTGAEDSTVTINFTSVGAESSSIKLDFAGGTDDVDAITQFGSDSTIAESYQDGYEMGVLNDYSVGDDGVIQGVYSNGQTEDLYTVALAVFSNASGLEKLGSGVYRSTSNSGIPTIVKPGEGGAGSITGSSLEASNVDLTSEFVDLIIAERGFQASARVITTSDDVLEELMNLKR